MDRFEAARTLGLADAEVLDVKDTEDGTAVRVRDGSDRLIVPGDGVYALTDHTATVNFRRWEGTAPAEALAEQAEEPADVPDIRVELPQDSDVPDGNADAVLDWVGDDPARAAQALTVETERDNPRSTLISKLRKVGP